MNTRSVGGAFLQGGEEGGGRGHTVALGTHKKGKKKRERVKRGDENSKLTLKGNALCERRRQVDTCLDIIRLWRPRVSLLLHFAKKENEKRTDQPKTTMFATFNEFTTFPDPYKKHVRCLLSYQLLGDRGKWNRNFSVPDFFPRSIRVSL